MRLAKEGQTMDVVADSKDTFQVRLQPSIVKGKHTLYVDCNGITILRVGGIMTEVSVTHD